MRNGLNKTIVVLAVALAVLIGIVIGVSGPERITTLLERLTHGDSHHHTDETASGKQLWTCSMHHEVIRDAPGLCPICHMKLTPLDAPGSQPTTSNAALGEPKVKYWWDPMLNPPYISDHP